MWPHIWVVLAVASLIWAEKPIAAKNPTSQIANPSPVILSAPPRAVLASWDFEDGAQGWTPIDGNGDGTTWTVGTTGDLDIYEPPDYGTQYAYYSDDDAGLGAGAGDEIWYSPSTDISGETELYLIFGWGARVLSTAETLACYVVFNTASSPETSMVWVYTGTSNDDAGTDTIDLSGYLPKNDIVVYFRYVDPDDGWYWAVGVDNIVLTTSVTPAHDVAAHAILSPTGSVLIGSSVTPQARVTNYGANAETFDVNFVIVNTNASPWDTLYEDLQSVTLASGDTVDVTFTPWTVSGGQGQELTAVARTLLSTDEVPTNDTVISTFSLYSTSGSDGYGWQWADSNDPAGPTYNWVDIWGNTANADSVDTLALGDDGEAVIHLYNALQIYGAVFDSFWVGSNGAIDFEDTQIGFSNTALPATGQYRFFAVFWEDLRCADGINANNPNGDSLVYVGYFADTLVVIEWHQVPRFNSGRGFTFELLIYTPRGGENRFVYQYKDVSDYDPDMDDATIGMQDNQGHSSNYILYTYNENPYTPNWTERAGHAIEFVNPEAVLVAESNENRPTPGLWVSSVVRNAASLRFTLPSTGPVTVDLYDAAGRHVRTLAHGTYTAGTHTLEANLNHLASGVYFVVLKSQNLSLSQRLVLVR